MATPINPTSPAANARPEVKPAAEERLTAQPQTKAASNAPTASRDFMERESARDTAQTRSQHHTGPGPSTASAESAATGNAAAGIEELGALAGKLGDVTPGTNAAASIGDVDPKLGQTLRVSDDQLKAIPSRILSHLLNPDNESADIDDDMVDAIDAVHISAAAGQDADAQSVFNKPVRRNPDLSDLITQIATTPAPSDENAPLSDDIIAPMERLIQGDYPMDIMAFVQWVLRESYLETTHSLRDFANRVRFFNDQKEAVRNELDRVRGILSNKPGAEAGDQVGPFESAEFDEVYLGTRSPNLPSTQIQGLVQDQLKLHTSQLLQSLDYAPTPEADAAFQAALSETTNHEVYGDRALRYKENYGSSTDYACFDRAADAYTEELLAYIDQLTPEQKDALLEHYKDSPLMLEMSCYDTDWNNDTYTSSTKASGSIHIGDTITATAGGLAGTGAVTAGISASIGAAGIAYLGLVAVGAGALGILAAPFLETSTKFKVDAYGPRPGQSLENYIRKAVEEQVRSFKNQVKSEEGGINIEWIEIKTPQMTTVAPKYTPAELAAAHPASNAARAYLNSISAGPSASSSSSTNSTAHFSAGDTVNTKAEAEAYVEYLENRLNTIGDDAQLANVDLQNWLQKQQQTLQMMSTISKQLHDTAMSIIRKIGG